MRVNRRSVNRLCLVFGAAIASILPIGARCQVWVYHTLPAVRATVVRSEGYFPVVVRLKNGAIAAVLRGGGAHLSVHGRIDWVESHDAGRTWTSPRAVAQGRGDYRNPALGRLADGTVVLAYSILRSYDKNGNFIPGNLNFDSIYTVRSKDNGRSWDKPMKTPLDSLGASPFGRIVQLRDGTVLMNVVQDKGEQNTWLYRSRDDGKTWGDPTLIGGQHYDECALEVLPSGPIAAALRSEPPDSSLYISLSRDKGYTWSPPQRVTERNEVTGDLDALRNGWLLLTYGVRNRPYGVQTIISRDGGRTWDKKNKIVIAWDAQNSDCGYPKSIQLADGRILTMYYGVDGEIDPEGKKGFAPQGAYAEAVIWSVPKYGMVLAPRYRTRLDKR